VTNDPAYTHVLSDLKARLRKMMEETKDPCVVKFQHE
jgi:hypothetical protein